MAEGARLEIVYTPKAYPGFKSQTLRQNYSSGACGRHFRIALRRGGRVVECGGLENRLPFRGYEGSNPSSSAIVATGARWEAGPLFMPPTRVLARIAPTRASVPPSQSPNRSVVLKPPLTWFI